MREKKRLLENAGLDAKRILSEADTVDFEFDLDEPEDWAAMEAELKDAGAKIKKKWSRGTRDYITVEIPTDARKRADLFHWVANFYYQGDRKDAAYEFPELT